MARGSAHRERYRSLEPVIADTRNVHGRPFFGKSESIQAMPAAKPKSLFEDRKALAADFPGIRLGS